MPFTTIQEARNKKKGTIQHLSTVPKEAMKMSEWKKGDRLYWEREGKGWFVKKIENQETPNLEN